MVSLFLSLLLAAGHPSVHKGHAPIPAIAAEDWPGFRGPGAKGVIAGSSSPSRWTATENIAWKTDLPGRGWSSPIVTKGKLFVTTVVNKGNSEPVKKGLYFGGERKTPDSEQEWKLICLDAAKGTILWEKTARKGKPDHSIHLKNSFASETPVTDGERIYALFGNVCMTCYDLNGKQIWSRAIPARKTRFGWGTASSPLLYRDRIYLQLDNEDKSELVALDKRTGVDVWRLDREEKSNWASPQVWEHDGQAEIVTAGTGKVRSYDLNGKLIWWLSGMSSITIATPYVDRGLLYITSGYVGDRLRPVYVIKPGATGDITPPAGQTTSAFVVWSNPAIGPYNPATLVVDGRLYILYDRGLLSCFDAKSGRMIYDKERLPEGLHFTSSPWSANGKIYCINEDAVTWVITAGNKFQIEGTNPLGDGEMCMATPAAVGDRLFIRTAARIYCVKQTGK